MFVPAFRTLFHSAPSSFANHARSLRVGVQGGCLLMSLGNLQCLATPGTPREVTTSVHASGFHLAARRHLQMASGIMSTTPQNTLAQSKCIWLVEEELSISRRPALCGEICPSCPQPPLRSPTAQMSDALHRARRLVCFWTSLTRAISTLATVAMTRKKTSCRHTSWHHCWVDNSTANTTHTHTVRGVHRKMTRRISAAAFSCEALKEGWHIGGADAWSGPCWHLLTRWCAEGKM